MRRVLRIAWYRFRVTFAARRGSLLAIVLLIALIGGLAIGAVAGARRTQSSFPAYLAKVDASDLELGTALYDPQIPGFDSSYDPGTIVKIARLPHVKRIADFIGVDPNIVPLAPSHGHTNPGEAPPEVGGSLDGEYSALDRVTVKSGRLADPRRVDEVVMSASAAREIGAHVGSRIPLGFFTNEQLTLDGCCDANGKGKLAPHLEVDLKLVGIIATEFNIVADDVDRLGNDQPVLLTPALIRQLVRCCSFYTDTFIEVSGGSRNARAVAAEITRAIPKLKGVAAFSSPSYTSDVVTTAERAIAPESIALGVFGAVAAIAALLIAGQLIGRQLRVANDERAVLRALGASPAATVADGLLGVVGAVVVGALLAGVVAVALSPLAPLGPVSGIEPRSIAFDWAVLGVGVAGLIVVLGLLAGAIGYRQAPYRIAGRRGSRIRRSRIASAAAGAGLSTPAVTGIRFALEPGGGSDAVPVRSAIIGAVVAVIVVTSTLTFGTSLRTLVSHPALYGWNWSYQLLSGFSGQENLPENQVTPLLDHDPYVSAWSGVYFGNAHIDGQAVPVIGTRPGATVAPPLLSGHGFETKDEVVLGAATLAALHKRLGDTVEVSAGASKPTSLRIVGTATMPAIGTSGLHPTMGIGALLSYEVIPATLRNIQGSPATGPQAILIRIRKGANPAAALKSLQRINDSLTTPGNNGGGVTGVLRPAEIVNYRSMGTTPALLGAALAVGAVAALMLTLVASVRRRRRELALLKTLGFTRRQLAAVVAWQSTVSVAIGVVIGVPLGIIGGRVLWDLFARAIHAVPQPTVPALTITLVAAGALVLANLVAAIPGLQAARTRTAVLLRAE